MDLRCDSKKFGELCDGVLDVKCSSRFCGAGPGVVVIHRFDSLTGELLETKRFRDPMKEVQNDSADSLAVRTT